MSVRRRSSSGFWLAVLATLFVARAQPQSSEAESSKALWEVNARHLGYKSLVGEKRVQTFIDFTDANHVVFAWAAPDDPDAAKKAGWLTPVAAHLHVVVFDARTGEKQRGQEWSTPSLPIRLFGLDDGRIVTCTGSVLRQLSPSLDVTREQNLPNERACVGPPRGPRGFSPSRRSLLLCIPPRDHFLQRDRYQCRLLDVETFSTLGDWVGDRGTAAVSDHWLAGFCASRDELCIRAIHGSWRPFQPTAPGGERPRSAFFANDEALVIEAGKQMAIATPRGEVLFQVELPDKRSFGDSAASSRGERFAIIENRSRGLKSEPLDMYPYPSNSRAVVYSIPARRAIFAVRLGGASLWKPTRTNQLALSPDGALLAVFCEGVLKVYRLPEVP